MLLLNQKWSQVTSEFTNKSCQYLSLVSSWDVERGNYVFNEHFHVKKKSNYRLQMYMKTFKPKFGIPRASLTEINLRFVIRQIFRLLKKWLFWFLSLSEIQLMLPICKLYNSRKFEDENSHLSLDFHDNFEQFRW
jgi:hypothetical protein